MKILNVYRSEPSEDTKKLVEIVSEGRESDSFDLAVDSPDYVRINKKRPHAGLFLFIPFSLA
jgi:hypothetical protein